MYKKKEEETSYEKEYSKKHDNSKSIANRPATQSAHISLPWANLFSSAFFLFLHFPLFYFLFSVYLPQGNREGGKWEEATPQKDATLSALPPIPVLPA